MAASNFGRSLSGILVATLFSIVMACGGGSNKNNNGSGTTPNPGGSNPAPGGTGTTGSGGTTTGGTTTGGSSTGGTTTGGTGTTTGGTGTTSGGTTGGTTGSGSNPAQLVYAVEGTSLAGFAEQANGSVTAVSGVQSRSDLDDRVLAATPDSNWLFSVTRCTPPSCSDGFQLFNQAINSGGPLGAPQQLLPNGQRTIGVIADSTSRFVYALSPVTRIPPIESDTGCSAIQQTLTAYLLASDGKLQPLNSSIKSVDSGDCPASSGGFPQTEIIGFSQDSSGTWLWLTQAVWGRGPSDPNIMSVPVAADGKLGTLKNTGIRQYTQATHAAVAGQYLVVAETRDRETIAPNSMTTFRLQNGEPQFATQCATSVPACHAVFSIATSADGKNVYTLAAPEGATWLVSALALDPATGALTPIGAPRSIARSVSGFSDDANRAMAVPHYLALDRAGQHLLISRVDENKITTVAIDPVTGGLGAAVDSNAGGNPRAIVSAAK